jgi:VIT1/CCC1 family predicted Fe2+/Mn2+ transporter
MWLNQLHLMRAELQMAKPEVHHSHGDVTGGWLRPAVFGITDGLISNLSLMSGVAGGANAAVTATDAHHAIILAGMAGMVAGAFSMAGGEYVSVASQSDYARAEIAKERAELQSNPDGERAELVHLWESRGLSPAMASQVVDELTKDLDAAVEVHSREELGLTLADLPSPWTAAGSSFLAFLLGAFIPLLPFLLGATTLVPAAILAGVGLFVSGAAVARYTARPWWFSALRQLGVGALAAGVTYGLGALVGHGLG